MPVTAGFDGSLLICPGDGGRELPGRGGTPSRDTGTCPPRALRAMETFTVSGATGARSLALATWLGYGLGVVGWLGLPLYALLLAARVFGRPESPTRFRPADPDHVAGAVRP